MSTEKQARPSLMENVKTLNSVVRTMLVLAFLGVVGWLGWLGYDRYVRPGLDAELIREQMAALQVKFDEQAKELEKTRTALRLVKVDHRKAVIEVLESGVGDDQVPWFDVKFVEVSPEGVPLAEGRTYRLKGDKMFVDTWLIKFDDMYVEEGDALRGGTLCIFKGIWGDRDTAETRHTLDDPQSDTETAYGPLNGKSELEQQVWGEFWAIANDPQRQKQLGVRANHGQINYIQVGEPGTSYEVNLRASDGMTIKVSKGNNT